MKLFFTGCSFTYGDDLEDPGQQSWPAIVAKEKKRNFLNNAISGASNERIVYQVVKNIDQYDKFYIAWSSIDRFTRYRSDNNFEINFNPGLTHGLYQDRDEFVAYGKMHYTYWHSNLYSFKLWLHQIVLLQSLLSTKNKSYVMLNAFPNKIKRWSSDWQNFNNNVKSLLCFDSMSNQQLYDEHAEIQQSLGQINFDHFIGWSTWNLYDFSRSFAQGPTGHPLQTGHVAIANHLLAHDIH